MTANFFAFLREGDDTTCRRIRVAKAVQQSLTDEFERQAAAFLSYQHRTHDADGAATIVSEDSERIPFFPIYAVHDHAQVFEIEPYALDALVLQAAKNPDSVEPLKLDDETMPTLRAICAAFTGRNSTKILFQGFERRRLLAKNRWTFLQDATVFTRLDRPGFTVADTIHAIYDNGTLLFRSFSVTARFISLITLFNEASDEKVEQVLQHKVLHVDDVAAVIKHADTIMRKQFAAVSELGVLDKIEPKKARKIAEDFDIDLALVDVKGKAKIDFPKTKKEQKDLLTFLTEGFYKGPLTGTAYQSNSHRPKSSKKSAKHN